MTLAADFRVPAFVSREDIVSLFRSQRFEVRVRELVFWRKKKGKVANSSPIHFTWGETRNLKRETPVTGERR
jgi:hypothetical protein